MVREVSFTAGTREDEIIRVTAAKLLKQVERYCRYADSASPRSFAEAVNLTPVIKSLDVFPPNACQRSTAISETLQPKRYAPPIRATKNPTIADGVIGLTWSVGGYIRNHRSCPAFPNDGSCMAFN